MSKKSSLRVAWSPTTSIIYAGFCAADGSMRDGCVDATSDVLAAVINYVGPNKSRIVNVDGVPTYRISVEVLPPAKEEEK